MPDRTTLEAMKVVDLRKLAKTKKISLAGATRKSDIVSAILDAKTIAKPKKSAKSKTKKSLKDEGWKKTASYEFNKYAFQGHTLVASQHSIRKGSKFMTLRFDDGTMWRLGSRDGELLLERGSTGILMN